MRILQPSLQETQQPFKAPPTLDPLPADPPLAQRLRLYRKRDILGDKKSHPPIAPIIPISNSFFYELLKKGILPAGIKFGRNRFWPEEQVQIMRAVIGAGEW